MQYWSITDAGCVRAQNQDTCQVQKLQPDGLLCVVCDGMGGAKSGNVASILTADAFVNAVTDRWDPDMTQQDTDILLRAAVNMINTALYEQSTQVEDFAGMGTTLVGALICGKNATVVNVGDSRAYHIGAQGIRIITKDHSVVQMMVERGEMTPEEARTFPGKNLITRAIGTEPTVQSDIFHLEIARGESILLCSDGLSNMLDEQELLFEVLHGGDREDCCQRLLEIARHRGAPDNVTCVLAQV